MEDYFADYDVYSDDSIVNILPDGIECSDGRKILFDECARNYYHHIGSKPDAKYIGEKDADDGSFIFYCSPHPVMVKFLPRFLSKSVQQRMTDWEKQMNKYGYLFFREQHSVGTKTDRDGILLLKNWKH